MPRKRWGAKLTEPIYVNDRGVERILRTLEDAAHFAGTDNPFERREAWQSAAHKLLAAAESGSAEDIKAATNQVTHALLDDGRLSFKK